jgi:two-component system, NtrC family, sensor kinase
VKKIIFLMLCFCVPRLIDAQTNYADSLKQQLATARDDTTRIIILNKLSKYYTYSIPDSSVLFSQDELLLAKKLKSSKWEVSSLVNYGAGLYVMGNYYSALDYGLQLFTLAAKVHDTSSMIDGCGLLGSVFRDIGDYNHALYYSLTGKNLSEKLINKNWLSVSLGIIGSIYEKSDQLDSALTYSKEARESDNTVNGKYTLGFIQFTLGNIYAKKGNYPEAIKYYRKSIDLAIVSNYKKDLMDSWNGIAKTFLKTGQVDSAIFYSKQAIFAGQSTAYPLGALEASAALSGIYKSLHKLDSSVKYNEMAYAIKDSIFNKEKITQFQNLSFSEEIKQQEIDAAQSEYASKIKIYILSGGLAVLLLIGIILIRNNHHKQKAYALLQRQKQEIDIQKSKVEQTLAELKATQSQLIQSEKMASLGELTAGIAHEIQNPLNFVNNFSEVNTELIEEMKTELKAGNNQDAIALANDIADNEQKINHHGKRADAIVKGMLQHSRRSSGVKEPTDINALADEYLRLAYHGLRAKDKSLSAGQAGFNATMKTDFDETIGNINVVPQDIGRVVLNLINNAFYAAPLPPEGGFKGPQHKHEPTVWVSTKKVGDKVLISVRDNGPGIPQKILDKIFQPFFTTKPTGQGTGLGLSLSYDIIKAHGGELKVETREGEGSEFIIQLPMG